MRSAPKTRPREHRPIDREEQSEVAVEAFERNGFFILLVDDRRLEARDEEFKIKACRRVILARLTMPVGG